MKEIFNEDVKEIQLGILDNVAKFCEINKIKYSLSGGTLLGSIRHGGYIPWDDDIDILMLREDYNKFIKTYNLVNDKFQVLSPRSNIEYPFPFAKVIDDNTILIENNSNMNKFELGINIDIFPIDSVPDCEIAINELIKRINRFKRILIIKSLRVSPDRKAWKNVAIVLGKITYSVYNPNRVSKKINKIALRYSQINSKKRGCLVWGYGKKEILDGYIFENIISNQFEGYKFKIIKDYDLYLTSLYGNYMELPPKEDRISHHNYRAYMKEI